MLNVAVVGIGWWGQVLITLMEKSPKFKVVKGVKRNPSTVADFSREHGIEIISDYAAVLKDPSVQAVVLCTPHTQHTEDEINIMVRWIFNDQFGAVNALIEAFGGTGQPWLVQRWSAFSIIVLTDCWLWIPWFTLLLVAGLQSLPKEPFEAAAIDGTSRWRVFWHLTVPMLRPVIVVCVVIRAIDAFRTFDIVWALTGGGPARQTELFSIYAYEQAFVFLNFGRGSAAAIIGALIILVVGLLLYRFLDRVRRISP